jgi:hypothetical protein
MTFLGLAAVESSTSSFFAADYVASSSPSSFSRSTTRPSAAVTAADEIGNGTTSAAQAQVEPTASASEPTPAALSAAPCASGSAVESGLQPHTVAVHRAACAQFPFISNYGGRGGGDHASGRALDIMVSGDAGWEIATFMRAHASELGISYVIYQQKIWSVQRSGDGWRAQPDRGSATANHYDHVHVSAY